jgi:hypothetical protein
MEDPVSQHQRPSRIVAVLLTALWLPTSRASDESVEPPLEYSVKVGDEAATLVEGKPLRICGTFTDPLVTVTPHTYRVFPYQGLNFKYPKGFTFKANVEDPARKRWILAGGEAKLIYSVLAMEMSTDDFVSQMVEHFAREDIKFVKADASITLGGQQLAGVSMKTAIAGHKLAVDVYRLPSRGSETRFLMIQDHLDPSGNRSKEGIELLAQMDASLVIEE